MVNSATELATGKHSHSAAGAIYLACCNGPTAAFTKFLDRWRPYWQGIQLDEVAFPIMLAWRARGQAAREFDPTRWCCACRYLICNGPATQQERLGGSKRLFSLNAAANITALTCAASYAVSSATTRCPVHSGYADFLNLRGFVDGYDGRFARAGYSPTFRPHQSRRPDQFRRWRGSESNTPRHPQSRLRVRPPSSPRRILSMPDFSNWSVMAFARPVIHYLRTPFVSLTRS